MVDNEFINENRKVLYPSTYPESWNGHVIVSRRSEIPLGVPPLIDEAKREIVNTATTREHFHDHDAIFNMHRAGPTCLCELRIITGQLCEPHLVKGEDGKTVETPSNRH
jgi:hypothetical protein